MLQWLKRKIGLEKRNLPWIPWSAAISDFKGRHLSGNLPQVRRCIQVYVDLIVTTELAAFDKEGNKKKSNLLEVLKRPARFLSRNNFWQLAVQNYFIEGNFYAYIKSNSMNGKIEALLPFLPGTMYCYATGGGSERNEGIGAHNDPLSLQNDFSYYYQSQFKTKDGKDILGRFDPEDIFHLKNILQTQDFLNGQSLYEAYTESLDLCQNSLDTADKFARNGMVLPFLVTGVDTENEDQRKQIVNALTSFFDRKGNYLTMPAQSKLEKLTDSPADFLRFLTSMSSLQIARLFSVPPEIVAREDGAIQSVGQGLRESLRFWRQTSGRAFLTMIEDALRELEPETNFQFLWRMNQGNDLRETGTFLKAMIESGILNEKEAKNYFLDDTQGGE